MRALVLVVGFAGFAVGCKGGAGADKFDEILGQLESFKTQMCACKDVACADKVTEARREYRKTMREKLDKGSKPSAAQDRKGKALEVELQACRKALVPETGSAGSGSAVENAD